MHNISQFGLAMGLKSTIFIVLLFEMNVPPVDATLEMNQAGNDHYPVRLKKFTTNPHYRTFSH